MSTLPTHGLVPSMPRMSAPSRRRPGTQDGSLKTTAVPSPLEQYAALLEHNGATVPSSSTRAAEDASAAPYSWRPMVSKDAPISDSRIPYETLIRRVTWTGGGKPNLALLARGLTSRAIDGAAVSHAAECEDEGGAENNDDQYDNTVSGPPDRYHSYREHNDGEEDVVVADRTAPPQANSSPTFVSVDAPMEDGSSSQPLAGVEDPDLEQSPPRPVPFSNLVDINMFDAKSPLGAGHTTHGGKSGTFDEPSPLVLSATVPGIKDGSRPSSRGATSDAPSMMSGTLQLRYDDDSSSSGRTTAVAARSGSIPSSSAFQSFESSARSGAAAHNDTAGAGALRSVSFNMLSSPPHRTHSQGSSAILWLPSSPNQDVTYYREGGSLLASPPSLLQVHASPDPFVFRDTTDVALAEHRHRRGILREYQRQWRHVVVMPCEEVIFAKRDSVDPATIAAASQPTEISNRLVSNGDERADAASFVQETDHVPVMSPSTQADRLLFRYRMCSEEFDEVMREEAFFRTIIEGDTNAEHVTLKAAIEQSLRVARGLGPLKRQIIRYAHRRRQIHAVRLIRRERCLADEMEQRRVVDSERQTSRMAILSEAVCVEESYCRQHLYRLYASTTLVTMYSWLRLLERCERYPICFASPLSASLRVSGRVCDSSLFHLLSHNEAASRAAMETAWNNFHLSMRAHVAGAVLVHGVEVASREDVASEEVEERWMLSITRYKVMAMYQRREVELTSLDVRNELRKAEVAAFALLMHACQLATPQ